jgi:hypothetical protein
MIVEVDQIVKMRLLCVGGGDFRYCKTPQEAIKLAKEKYPHIFNNNDIQICVRKTHSSAILHKEKIHRGKLIR